MKAFKSSQGIICMIIGRWKARQFQKICAQFNTCTCGNELLQNIEIQEESELFFLLL